MFLSPSFSLCPVHANTFQKPRAPLAVVNTTLNEPLCRRSLALFSPLRSSASKRQRLSIFCFRFRKCLARIRREVAVPLPLQKKKNRFVQSSTFPFINYIILQKNVFAVEKVLNKRNGRQGQVEFLIKWQVCYWEATLIKRWIFYFQGFPESENTWEPRENLQCSKMLEEFEREYAKVTIPEKDKISAISVIFSARNQLASVVILQKEVRITTNLQRRRQPTGKQAPRSNGLESLYDWSSVWQKHQESFTSSASSTTNRFIWFQQENSTSGEMRNELRGGTERWKNSQKSPALYHKLHFQIPESSHQILRIPPGRPGEQRHCVISHFAKFLRRSPFLLFPRFPKTVLQPVPLFFP